MYAFKLFLFPRSFINYFIFPKQPNIDFYCKEKELTRGKYMDVEVKNTVHNFTKFPN